MKRFLIFLGILFSSVFITSNVNAEYYTDGTITYDYNFLKVLISEQYNINLDDYNYFVSRTVVYDANYSHITPQIQFMFWNGSEPCIDRIADDDTLYVLSKTYDSVYYGSLVLKNNDNYSVTVSPGTGGKNYYENGFPVVLKRFTKFQGNDLYYSALASSVKGFNKLSFNDKTYDLYNLLSDKAVSDDDIVKNYNVNFHLNNGIAIDTYQSDIELQNIKNEMINSWTLYDTYKDKKSIMNDFNNLFLSPNLNDFTKFSNRYVTISNVSELKQIYMKVINKEYAQPIYYYEDFTINIKSNELEERLKKITITKENMSFKGLYYDDNYQNNVKENYIINSDVDLYAKYDYENVDDFLKDNTFKSYTFDENYAYAFISIGKNVGQDVYLGLDFLNYSIEIYKYDKTELKANKGSSFCLTPYFSKDNKYYYRLETINNDYYNVLVLPREKLITEENGIFTTHYNFLLTDNATVTYTNDLKQAEIVDDSGNKITIDIEDSYNYSQEAFLKDTDDLLTIFKNLLKNKDNNVFQYFEQVWQFLKRSKIFIYLNILIIGALIILIIKAANRR